MHLNIATDCSGIETPIMALDEMGVNYTHIWSCDNDKKVKKFIRTNFSPLYYFDDISDRELPNMEKGEIDIYVAGFPCQSFSSLGNNKGFKDKIKGTVYYHVYNTIASIVPKVFILENVKHLVNHNKGKTFNVILESLNQLDLYDIHYEVLNTMDYGVPQSRSRIYIIGILKDFNVEFNFPEKIPTPKVFDYLQPEFDQYESEPEQLSERNISLLKQIVNKYPDIDWIKEQRIINIGVSSIEWFRIGKPYISPCLTTSPKFLIPARQRFLKPLEALKLQAIPYENYDFSDFSSNEIFKFAGNSMSVNLLINIFTQIFNAKL